MPETEIHTAFLNTVWTELVERDLQPVAAGEMLQVPELDLLVSAGDCEILRCPEGVRVRLAVTSTHDPAFPTGIEWHALGFGPEGSVAGRSCAERWISSFFCPLYGLLDGSDWRPTSWTDDAPLALRFPRRVRRTWWLQPGPLEWLGAADPTGTSGRTSAGPDQGIPSVQSFRRCIEARLQGDSGSVPALHWVDLAVEWTPGAAPAVRCSIDNHRFPEAESAVLDALKSGPTAPPAAVEYRGGQQLSWIYTEPESERPALTRLLRRWGRWIRTPPSREGQTSSGSTD